MTTLQTLGLAYRKAKVDLYYSSHASLDAIADYEASLHTRPSSRRMTSPGSLNLNSLAVGHWLPSR